VTDAPDAAARGPARLASASIGVVAGAAAIEVTLLSLQAARIGDAHDLGSAYSPDVLEQLKKGLGLLDSAASTIRGLSATYSDQVETLDVFQLQRDWNKAEASFWPLSWARKRTVQKILESVATGDAIPIAALDVHALAKVSALYQKMSAIDIGTLTDGVWVALSRGGRRA